MVTASVITGTIASAPLDNGEDLKSDTGVDTNLPADIKIASHQKYNGIDAAVFAVEISI